MQISKIRDVISNEERGEIFYRCKMYTLLNRMQSVKDLSSRHSTARPCSFEMTWWRMFSY
jgi:hypothetical protein